MAVFEGRPSPGQRQNQLMQQTAQNNLNHYQDIFGSNPSLQPGAQKQYDEMLANNQLMLEDPQGLQAKAVNAKFLQNQKGPEPLGMQLPTMGGQGGGGRVNNPFGGNNDQTRITVPGGGQGVPLVGQVARPQPRPNLNNMVRGIFG
jgi:hypothetical protein